MIEQVKNVTFTFANSECIGRCLGCNSFNQLVICIIIWTSWKLINPVSVPRVCVAYLPRSRDLNRMSGVTIMAAKSPLYESAGQQHSGFRVPFEISLWHRLLVVQVLCCLRKLLLSLRPSVSSSATVLHWADVLAIPLWFRQCPSSRWV